MTKDVKTLVRPRSAVDANLGRAFQRWFFDILGRKKHETNNIKHNLMGSVSEARVIDVCLCARLCGKAGSRTRNAAEFHGVGSEADSFN